MEGSKAEKKREPVSRIVVEAGGARGSEELLKLAGRAGVPVALRGEWEVAVSRDSLHNATLEKLRLDPGPALQGEVVFGGKDLKNPIAPAELERRLLWQLVERLEREVAELRTVSVYCTAGDGKVVVAVEAERGDGTPVPIEEQPAAFPSPYAGKPDPAELRPVDLGTLAPEPPAPPYVRVGDVWVNDVHCGEGEAPRTQRVDAIEERLGGPSIVQHAGDGEAERWINLKNLHAYDWRLHPSSLEVGDRVRLLPLEGKPPEGVNKNPALHGKVGRIEVQDYELDGTVRVVDIEVAGELGWSCWWDAKRVERLAPEGEKEAALSPRVEVGCRARMEAAEDFPEECVGGRGFVDQVDPKLSVAHLTDLGECGDRVGVWWPLDKLVVLSPPASKP